MSASWVRDDLRPRINAGDIPAGAALSGVASLAAEYGEEALAIRRALHELAQGLVTLEMVCVVSCSGSQD